MIRQHVIISLNLLELLTTLMSLGAIRLDYLWSNLFRRRPRVLWDALSGKGRHVCHVLSYNFIFLVCTYTVHKKRPYVTLHTRHTMPRVLVCWRMSLTPWLWEPTIICVWMLDSLNWCRDAFFSHSSGPREVEQRMASPCEAISSLMWACFLIATSHLLHLSTDISWKPVISLLGLRYKVPIA